MDYLKCHQFVAKGSKAHSALSKTIDAKKRVCIESRRPQNMQRERKLKYDSCMSPRNVVWCAPLSVLDEVTLNMSFCSDSVLAN